MSPRFWRWVVGVSWALIALWFAMMLGGIGLGLETAPAWTRPLSAVAFLVAFPLALWGPVFLVFSHAGSRQALRTTALVGFGLTLASLCMTFTVITDGNSEVWRLLRRASLPVMLLTLACALLAMTTMTSAGPLARRLLASGVAALFTAAVIVAGMVAVDSGNRTLFALLAALLAWSLLQLPFMLILRRLARRGPGGSAALSGSVSE